MGWLHRSRGMGASPNQLVEPVSSKLSWSSVSWDMAMGEEPNGRALGDSAEEKDAPYLG